MWALINNSIVAEITDIDPNGRFHPSLTWVECDSTTKPGDVYGGEGHTAPLPLDGNVLAQLARQRRDALLAECDWVSLRATDSGGSMHEAWHTYRQDLRDIPEQQGFPHAIVWPSAPAE